jgi:hypothetical protein
VQGVLKEEGVERGAPVGGIFDGGMLEDALVRSCNRMRPAPREKGGMADVRTEASPII